MRAQHKKLASAVRQALGTTPAIAGAGAIALVLTAGMPAVGHAAGVDIVGETRGPVTNSRTIDYLLIDMSTIRGDVTNTDRGRIGDINEPPVGIEITDSRIKGALINDGRVRSDSEGIDLDNAQIDDGFTNTGRVESEGSSAVYVTGDSFGGGIRNSGTLTGETGIYISADKFTGGIRNSSTGLIRGRDGSGIDISNDTFTGGIHNEGTIDGADYGIDVSNTVFKGGIHNSGDIFGRTDTGVYISVDTFMGGIHNTGSIHGETDGIYLSADTFYGGIHNSGSIVGATDTGLDVSVDTFDGGIHNSGIISGLTYGVYVSGDTFNGGIHNSGTISSGSSTAVYVSVDTFYGGIHNSGSISTNEHDAIDTDGTIFYGGIHNSGNIFSGTSNGIDVDTDTFMGGIYNSGSIESGDTGIVAEGDFFYGGIHNSGSILAHDYHGIYTDAKTFSGGIYNSGSIDAHEDAIGVDSDRFVGSVENSGNIISRDETGIAVEADTFTGAVRNSGRIEAWEHAIYVGTQIPKGVWNSGTLFGVHSAIDVENGLGAPTVINLTGGAVYGDILLSGTESDIVNVSGGMMDGTIDGTKGARDDTVNFLMTGNTVTFGGDILGVDLVFVDPGTLVLTGGIYDTNSLEVDAATRLVLGETADANPDTYSQHRTATLGFIADPKGKHGHITADTVNLAGNLQIVLDSGEIYSDSLIYTDLVNWTTRNGRFNAVTSESIFLAGRQIYGPTSLSVAVSRVPFNAYGQTGNQRAVANGLEGGYSYPATSPNMKAFYSPLFALNNTGDYYQFLDAVSGSTHANALQATMYTSQVVNQAVQQRLDGVNGAMTVASSGGGASADATPGQSSVWVQALGVWGDGDGDENAAGFDQTTGGVAFGYDYQLSEENLVGVLGAYLSDEIDFDHGFGKTDVDTWQIGAYAQHDTESWYANGLLTYGWNDYDSNRRLNYWNRSENAKGSYDGTAFVLYGEAGYKYKMGGDVTVKPMLGLGYVSADTDGFMEQGSSLYNLRVKSGSGDSFSSNLGVRATMERTVGNGMLITGDARLLWQHEFQDDYQSLDASFVTVPGARFSARGSSFPTDSAIVGLGIKAQVAPQSEVFLNWNGRFASDYTANSLFAGARFKW